MFNGNGYPLGAENDPNAPWNEQETTFEKPVGAYVTLYIKHLYVTKDENGETVSDIREDADNQLEDAIRKGDYTIEEVEED